MKADRVEVSHDGEHAKRWIVRIQVGGEVLRRHLEMPKNPDEAVLRSAAEKLVQDEGYSVDPASVVVV